MKSKNHILALSILCIFCILFWASSTPQNALVGKYQDTPYEIQTSKSLDETWSKIIDLFATKGLSIKIIDKSSGLITSEKISFRSSYSYENGDGTLSNPGASVVLSRLSNAFGNTLEPHVINGEWNIHVKSIEGKTIINVNLVNLNAEYHNPPSQYSAGFTTYWTSGGVHDIKSTGIFEKLVADLVR